MQRPRGDNQQRILEFIKSEISTKGYPPSVREIANAVGLKSTSTVHGHLQRLEKRGLLHRDAMKPRAMEVTGDPSLPRAGLATPIPVVGHVTAGQPILAEENLDEYIALPDMLLGDGEHFVLKVHGDSMIEAGILDGDHIIGHRQALLQGKRLLPASAGEPRDGADHRGPRDDPGQGGLPVPGHSLRKPP